MDKNIVAKGKLGEKIISEEIGKVDLGKGIVVNNAIFKFPSILYRDGAMTTQIDHLILTESIILCIETKYYEHLVEHNFWAREWGTDYEKDIENPIWQNRKHKEILSNILGVKLEDIITIEVVIGSDIRGYSATNVYPNDYICDEKSFGYLLELLIASKYENSYVFEELKNIVMEACITYGVDEYMLGEIEAEHDKRLKYANRINVWLRRRDKRTFHFCDIAYCQECGRLLAFRKYNSLKEGNKKKSIDFLIGCTGYNSYSANGCKSEAIYDFEQINRENFLLLEEEQQNMTLVELIEEKEALKKLANERKKEVHLLNKQVCELKSERQKLRNRIEVLKNEKQELVEERNKFKKVIGTIYYREQ